jgi:hypothetical protein
MRYAAPTAALALILPLLSGCTGSGAKEVPVAMADVPPAVRATLDRESKGGTVTEVEKEVKNGKTIYSADATINGVAWDIAVAEDGTLLSKEKEKAGEP